MMLLLCILLAIGLGLARGGRFAGLSRVSLRGGVAILVLFAAQLFLRQLAPALGLVGSSAIVWLWCCVSVCLVLLCVMNWRIQGIPLVALGITLNLVVVVLNTGMPVGGSLVAKLDMSPSVDSIKNHGGFYRAIDAETVAPVLGDVIPIPAPRPLRSLVSLGDMVMFVGAGVLVEEGMRAGRYRARHAIGPRGTVS